MCVRSACCTPQLDVSGLEFLCHKSHLRLTSQVSSFVGDRADALVNPKDDQNPRPAMSNTAADKV